MDIHKVIKTDEDGHRFFDFKHVFISDIHWGTHSARAKALCRMLPHIRTEELTLVGDIVDGWHMSEKESWNLGSHHRQGIAHVLRMEAEKVYIPGNHEDNLREKIKAFPQHNNRRMLYRNLIGGEIFDIKVMRNKDYTDPRGKRYFVTHGDEFDPQLYTQNDGFWYHFGDSALSKFAHLDHRINEQMGWEEFSSAARVKSVFKKIAERVTGVKERAAEYALQNNYDGLIYGHSHISEFDHRDGIEIINDGCGTDGAPEFLIVAHDGEKAILKWHKDHLRIANENNSVMRIPWNVLGMDHFGTYDPPIIEDEYTQKADRLIRVMYRMWPGQDREKGMPHPIPHPRHGDDEPGTLPS